MEVVSRLVLVTALSVPGGVAVMPGDPGSTLQGWGGLLAGSHARAGAAMGVRGNIEDQSALDQDQTEAVTVGREGCGGAKQCLSQRGDSACHSQEAREDTASP